MIIQLCGMDVIIDDEDFQKINSMKWALDEYRYKIRGKAYFRCSLSKIINGKYQRSVWLHRFIMNQDSWNGLVVDHANGNTLDNRKLNLRICPQLKNSQNRAMSKNNSSGYKGVNWNDITQRWHARIGVNWKRISLGYYDTPEEAYAAYCEASKKYHGEYGRTR